MPTPKQVAQAKVSLAKLVRILEKSDDILYEEIRGFQNSFFSSVKKLLKRFVVGEDGKIDRRNRRNKRLINSIRKTLNATIAASTYSRKVRSFIKNFDEVKRLNALIHRGLSDIEISNAIRLTPIQEEFVERVTFNLLNKEAIEANLITPIKRILRTAATRGLTFKEAEDQLRDHIKGEVIRGNQRAGQIERYVRQNTFEAINRYNGAIQSELDSQFEFDGIQITGSIIKTSSEQCKDFVFGDGPLAKFHLGAGKYLKKDLPEIIRILQRNPTGEYRGVSASLTPESLFELRLHFGCRHVFYPIKLQRRDLRRAVSMGRLTLEEAGLE